MRILKDVPNKYLLELSFAELDTLVHGVSIITDVIKSKVDVLVPDVEERKEIIKSSIAYQLYTELLPVVTEARENYEVE